MEGAAAFGEAGVDLVVVGLPAPYDPGDVDVVADALTELTVS
jgi:hypothetical protein